MKRIFTLSILTFFGLASVGSAVPFDCNGSYAGMTETRAATRLTSRLAKLNAEDVRYGWQHLAEKSPKLNQVDDFVSPGTQALVFSRRPKQIEALQKIAKETGVTTDHLSGKGIELSPEAKTFLEMAESRFRVAASMVEGLKKSEGQSVVDPTSYGNQFQRWLIGAMEELEASAGRGKPIFSPELRSALADGELAAKLSEQARKEGFFDHTFGSETFHPDVVNAIHSASDLPSALASVSENVSARLKEVPVGIYNEIAKLNAMVRYGDDFYQGNYDLSGFLLKDFPAAITHAAKGEFGKAREILRGHRKNDIISTRGVAVMEKVAEKMGTGVMEIQFELPNAKKKNIATNLDRSHLNLDKLFGNEKACARHMNTCGSFVVSFFWENGVPVVTPVVLTPTVPFMSLAAQKAAGVNPQVKKVEFKHFTRKRLPISIAVLTVHDVIMGLGMETGMYALVGYGLFKAGDAIVDALSSDGSEEEPETSGAEPSSNNSPGGVIQ